MSIFNSEVDDSGFDLVLACRQKLPYLQIRQVHLQGRASKLSIRQNFSLMIGSCIVVIVHTEVSLSIDHFLFDGGEMDEAMPPIDGNKPSIVPVRRRQWESEDPRPRPAPIYTHTLNSHKAVSSR